jgi:hypothetical protein
MLMFPRLRSLCRAGAARHAPAVRLASLRACVGALALLSPAATAGCDDPEDAETESLEPQPGDPAFERDPALDVENISRPDEQRSHNMGRNCMECHQAYGPGLGQFQAAGTIYGPDGTTLRNPIVELRTAPDGGGDVVLRIEGDALGNFFTTQALPLPEERLFPWVTSTDGTLVAGMPRPTASGACNHCHAGGFRVTVAPPE